jgi:hypothetical protein
MEVAMPTKSKASTSKEKQLELLMKAWEKVQDKQIHFDDMIVRTRALTFSVMVAGFAAVVTLSRVSSLSIQDRNLFLIVLMCFWFGAFLIDQFYYFRLLKGAVRTGDLMQNDLKAAGIVIEDVNADLTKAVSPCAAHAVIIAYYFIPLVPIVILIVKP